MLADAWTLDPEVVFLNHGSFGACPRVVLELQSELRARLERQPVRFFVRDSAVMIDDARETTARFVGAEPDGFAFVPNATTGVNAVVRSLRLNPGDELLTTDHAYNACRNALEFVAKRAGARVVVAPVPFPVSSPEAVTAALLDAASDRTVLALVDHITSPTGMVLPVTEIVAQLQARGIDVLVDGAHAPGMVDLDIRALGAAYYTGNLHKWVCAPKGAAFLAVRPDRIDRVRPVTISHGANASDPRRSRFRHEFDWVGTDDPTAALCVPTAIEVVGGLVPGGWDEVRQRNRALVLQGRSLVADSLGIESMPVPDSMIGSLGALPLPVTASADAKEASARPHAETDPLQDRLLFEHGIEVPVFPFGASGGRVIRVSAQLYNERAHYERLATALSDVLGR